ncbi:ABC transporter substrate-binding protein [Clostridia bacterium]|nr:ABC transporter substrate-binding protein [Clostridia bacterium]
MKKLAILLALMLCLTSVGSSFADVVVSGNNEYPIVSEPVTLSVWAPESSDAPDISTNSMTVLYEKMTGVHVEWTIVPVAEATTKFNLEIAGGRYHDVYAGLALTTDQVLMCMEGGVLIPLNPYIETSAPNFAAALNENPEFVDYLTTPDGNIYTMFNTDVGVHMLSQNKMFVYGDWYDIYKDQAGGEVKTTDDFKNMLLFFRDNDMNGNGIKDEVPLMSSYPAATSDPLGYLMNPFQLYNSNFFVISDDKHINFIANTDGWKEGLKYIHDLYGEGLIAEQTYVQDATQLKATVDAADNQIVGAVPSFWQGVFTSRWTSYVPIEPLEGPAGLKQAGALSGATFTTRAAISSQCKTPEVAVKWLDYWLSYDGTFDHTWGMDEGVDYELVDTESFAGTTPSVLRLQGMGDGGTVVNYRWGANYMPKYDRYDIRYAAVKDEANFNTNNTFVLTEAAKLYEPYYVSHNIPQIVWNSDVDLATEIAEMRTMLNAYILSSATEFVMGVRDIDAEWDAYLAQLDAMGLPEYLKLLERFYQ